MRRVVIALIVVLVCASAATGVRVHASTECERWVAEYRNALGHSPTVKRAKAAGHRIHHYVHRKIAALTKPKPATKPHTMPVRHRGPKMTREEMLRKFELACGDLPEDSPEGGNLPQDPTPTFIADRRPGGDEMPLDDQDGPGMLLAMNQPPSFAGGGAGLPSGPGAPGFFLPPGFGGLPGGAPHGNIPTNPPVTGTTGDNPLPPSNPPPPPVAETPEPGSLLLLATGLVGAAAVIRRRQRAA
jgi:hypothetical protein